MTTTYKQEHSKTVEDQSETIKRHHFVGPRTAEVFAMPQSEAKSMPQRIQASILMFVLLATTACTPGADDLSALARKAEQSAKTLSGESVASASQEVGRDKKWTLILVPAEATDLDLRAAGVPDESVARLSQRSETWQTDSFIAYLDAARLAYWEWPELAGRLERPLAVEGTVRTGIRVVLSRNANGVIVTALEKAP